MSEQAETGIVVNGKRYLTVLETAAMFKVSRRTVYNWIAFGKVKSACDPGGGRYVEAESLEMVPMSADSVSPGY